MDTSGFRKPEGDEIAAAVIVGSSVLLLVLLARTFRDVAPA